MRIRVNGKDIVVEDGCTVAKLLSQMGFIGRPLAVEVNKKVVKAADHMTTVLQDGDMIEIVTIVGGG